MKRAILTGAIVAAILAPTGSTGSGQPGSGPAPFPTCVIKVWEDGSAAFRDAEQVRADAACFRAVSDYVEAHPGR